jgi:hypothetical protein
MNLAAPEATGYCFIHDVFEDIIADPYEICFKCGHAYNTVDDYRLDMAAENPQEVGPGDLPDAVPPGYCVWCAPDLRP